MHEQAAVAFDLAAVLRVQVDGVSVKGQGAVVEEEDGRGPEGDGELWGVGRWLGD